MPAGDEPIGGTNVRKQSRRGIYTKTRGRKAGDKASDKRDAVVVKVYDTCRSQ